MFGMLHHLYLVCSNYAPGSENGPAPGLHNLNKLI